MKRNITLCFLPSLTFLVAALFSYFYESRFTGLLPVITYPLRPYVVLFAVTGVVLGASGLFLQMRKEK